MRRLLLRPLLSMAVALAATMQCMFAHAATGELRVGVLSSGWAPFAKVQGSRIVGVSVDTLALALKLSDSQIHPVVYRDIKSLLEAACTGDIDLVMYVADTPDRRKCLDFTAPYFEGDAATLGRPLEPEERALPPIASARLAVVPGSFLESVFQERYPRAQRVYVKDARDAMNALVRREADYYTMLEPVVNQLLGERQFDAIRLVRRYNEPDGALRFGVVKSAPALLDAIERGLAGISPQRSRDILARWSRDRVGGDDGSANEFFLTPQEESFLAALPTIRIGVDAGLAPYTYLDASGRSSGMAVDYLQYFSQVLGIRFQRVPTRNYLASVDAARGDELDMLAAAAKDDGLLDGIPITHPYASFPLVIVGRHEATPVSSVSGLAGTRVAVTEAGGVGTLLTRLVPTIELVLEPSVSAAMAAVVDGTAATYVDDLASVDVSLQREFGDRLKVIGSLGRSLEVGFAISPTLAPRLLPLLNRALSTLPDAERQAIQNRYIAASYVLGTDWTDVALRLAPLILGLLGVVAVLSRSQYLLRREATIRKATEQQLSDQLSFQTTLIDALAVPVVLLDSDLVVQACNVAFERIAGVDRDALVGSGPSAAGGVVSDILQNLKIEGKVAVDTGALRRVSMTLNEPSGGTQHLLCWLQPFEHFRDGKRGAIASFVDVTDIRLAEIKAREATARLKDVTDHLPATVFQLRQAKNGKISGCWVSGNTYELFHASADELALRGFSPYFAHEDASRYWSTITPDHPRGTPVTIDVRVNGETGAKWARLHAISRDDDERTVLWNGYLIDTTDERERTQALAQARDDAEAASRAKSDFLAMMSHEIRTPMSGVVGLVEILERSTLDEDQRAIVTMLSSSSGILMQVLNDVLDFSKIEAGKLELDIAEVDLRKLCDLALGLLAARAHDKGVAIRLAIQESVPAVVRGDAIRLQQILFNLLSNAIKFTAAGTVTLRLSSAAAPDGQETITWEIEDTGIGLSPAQLSRLFEPFVQAENSTSRRFEGTGLGLTICRRLTELMGGTIALQSRVGEGTTATFTLLTTVCQKHYPSPPLRGVKAHVELAESSVRDSLQGMLVAAGAAIVPADGLSPHDTAVIRFSDVAAQIGEMTLVQVTDRPKNAGFKGHGGIYRLSNNPLSWHAIKQVCRVLGRPAPAPDMQEDAAGPDDHGAAAPGAPDKGLSESVSILIVEDKAANRMLLKRQLKMLGFASDAAVDGKEALLALAERRYQLMLTDCHMPGVDGYELARRVRENEIKNGMPRMPILALTAAAEPESIKKCLDAGMDECLLKPITLDQLTQVLARWAPAFTSSEGND